MFTDQPVDGVTKALLKITESKFESQISSPLMDTILQPSPTRSRDDHMIGDDIIEIIIEVGTIIIIYNNGITVNSICSQWNSMSSPVVMIWYI